MKPTLNPEYNKYYQALLKPGWIATIPGCENCGKDLTNQNIIDTGLIWCCEECAKNKSNWAEAGKEVKP